MPRIINLQVGGRDIVAGDDGPLEGDDIVETTVSVEASLEFGEECDGTIGSSTTSDYSVRMP